MRVTPDTADVGASLNNATVKAAQALLLKHQTVTAHQMAQLLGRSDAQARAILNDLVREGLASVSGIPTRKTARTYHPIDPNPMHRRGYIHMLVDDMDFTIRQNDVKLVRDPLVAALFGEVA